MFLVKCQECCTKCIHRDTYVEEDKIYSDNAVAEVITVVGCRHENVCKKLVGKLTTHVEKEWIPVTERLPEKPEYDWVLVQVKMIPENYYGVPHIAELRDGKWYSDCYATPLEETAGVKVTHWQPLPAIPDEIV